jgi:hypothetical protein
MDQARCPQLGVQGPRCTPLHPTADGMMYPGSTSVPGLIVAQQMDLDHRSISSFKVSSQLS